MNQLKKGAILSYLHIFITNIVGLFLTPFIIKHLGNSEYGLYTLIGSVIAYLTLVDFGLSDTIIRFVAKYRAEENKIQERIFLGTIFKIYSFISLILIVLGLFIYFNIESIFINLSKEELHKAKIMFLILLINIFITLLSNIFLGIINAYEKFYFSKGIGLIKYFLRSILVILILFLGYKSIGLVIIDTIINFLFFIIVALYVIKKLKITFLFQKFVSKHVNEILSFSIWMFILSLISQFQWQGGQIILGIISNTKEIAIYAIGILLGTYYGAFSSAITGLFLPKATFMVVKNAQPEAITEVMIKIGRISIFILFYILGAFFLFGKTFIILWLGTFYLPSWDIAMLIMIIYTIPLVQTFANSLLEAKKRINIKAKIYFVFILLGTFLGYLLYSYFGVLGMAIGISIGWLLSIILLNFFYNKILQINILLFFKNVFILPIIVLIISVTLHKFLHINLLVNWVSILKNGIVYSMLYFVGIYFIMNNFEKKLFYKTK